MAILPLKEDNIMSIQKRIITVQDISCIGKCSATVALPIPDTGADPGTAALALLLLRRKKRSA